MDNGTQFRSRKFLQLLHKWDVSVRYRCAYRPAGNGIVERSHRSIKVIATRKRCSIPEAVYRYNVSPTDDVTAASAPASRAHNHQIRVRGIDRRDPATAEVSVRRSGYVPGERVWVRRAGTRCDQRSRAGVVTGEISDVSVEVDGVPHHVRDIRARGDSPVSRGGNEMSADEEGPINVTFDQQEPTCASTTDVSEEHSVRRSEPTCTSTTDASEELSVRRSERIRRASRCRFCDTCESGGGVAMSHS